MAKAKKSNIETYRSYAQVITIAAAALTGLMFALNDILGISSSVANTLGNVCIVVTVLGGISMGLLYSFDK